MLYRDLADFMNGCGYIIGGQWYPRVTSIISIKAKPALLKFYADAESYSHALSTTKQSASEGTKIHNAVEAILKNETPEQNPEILPAVNAFNDFLNMHSVNTKEGAIEKRVWSNAHHFAGTIDILAEVDGLFGVLDVKTSSGIWRDYNLQTSAYMGALQEDETWEDLPKKPVDHRWILRIDQKQICTLCGATKRTKGGRETIKTNRNNSASEKCQHEWSEVRGEWELKALDGFEKDYDAFLGAKKLWEWENEQWLRQIGY